MAKPLDEKVFDHFGRGLGPAMVFIDAHFHVAHAVNDAVVTQNAGSGQTSDEKRNLERCGAGLGCDRSEAQAVIARRLCGYAARGQTYKRNCAPSETSHSGSPQSGFGAFPGTCAGGNEDRSRVYGRCFSVSVNWRKFCEACRKLFRMSSIFSPLAFRVRSSWSVTLFAVSSMWRSSSMDWRRSERFSEMVPSRVLIVFCASAVVFFKSSSRGAMRALAASKCVMVE